MNKKQIVFYALAISVLSVGAWLTRGPLPAARAAGACCNYSEDCPGTLICIAPAPKQPPCNKTYPNYCQPFQG
jgi:hypothetical protein